MTNTMRKEDHEALNERLQNDAERFLYKSEGDGYRPALLPRTLAGVLLFLLTRFTERSPPISNSALLRSSRASRINHGRQ
jgi:hypothetical protein